MIAHGLPVYLALELVDMRFGYERLGGIVRARMQAELLARCNPREAQVLDVETSFPDEVRHVLVTVATLSPSSATSPPRNAILPSS